MASRQPNRLGVLGGDLQGYPNGRRLADDVVDIEILALEGELRGADTSALKGGDAVNQNDELFRDHFPYVATANNEGVNVTLGGDGRDKNKDSDKGGPFGEGIFGLFGGPGAPRHDPGLAGNAGAGAGSARRGARD